MNSSDKQTINEESKLILLGLAEIRNDVAEFRRESKEDFAEINATFDRIDGHLSDISQILRKTNQALV
jgi:hypothetical protein